MGRVLSLSVIAYQRKRHYRERGQPSQICLSLQPFSQVFSVNRPYSLQSRIKRTAFGMVSVFGFRTLLSAFGLRIFVQLLPIIRFSFIRRDVKFLFFLLVNSFGDGIYKGISRLKNR